MKRIILLLLTCMLTFLTACNSGEPYAKYDEDAIEDMFQDKYDNEEKWVDEENIKVYKQDKFCLFKDGKKIHIGMNKKDLEKIIGKSIKDGRISISNREYNMLSIHYDSDDELEMVYEACSEDFDNIKEETLIGIYVRSPEYKSSEGISVGDSIEKVTQILLEKYGEENVLVSDNKGTYRVRWDHKGNLKNNSDFSIFTAGSMTYHFYDGKTLSDISIHCLS